MIPRNVETANSSNGIQLGTTKNLFRCRWTLLASRYLELHHLLKRTFGADYGKLARAGEWGDVLEDKYPRSMQQVKAPVAQLDRASAF